MERRAIARYRRLQRHVSAGAENGRAMVAEQAVDQDDVARPTRCAPRSIPGRITPMPVVVMNSLSQAPLFTTLVSPVTIFTPASRAVAAIERAIWRRRSIGDSFLDDDGARQVQRHRAADGKIVDRAADRKLADVAAGKNQRIDDEGVGGEREPVAVARQRREIEPSLIVERGQ